MEIPILDIIVAKPIDPINDNLLQDYVVNIIKGKMAMENILHSDLTFLN